MSDLNTMLLLGIIIILALSFDFINGFHDTANSIATTVSTRVLSPKAAIIMAACLNFVGALLNHKVAGTVAKDIINNSLIDERVVIGALISAIIWNLITWYIGIPSSSSHALFGGMIGAAFVHAWKLEVVNWNGVWKKIIEPLLLSPVLGFLIGFVVMKFIYFIFRKFSQRQVNKTFSVLQIFSAAFMAYSHGNNDAQKSMGIITLALIAANKNNGSSNVQIWVILICAMAMALGTSIGGWKIIKTMGVNMIKLQPVQGFAAETSAALIIEGMSALGNPVSTTHIISTTIMGVGASKRLSAVRWALARNIVYAWILTLPVTIFLGFIIQYLIEFITKVI